MLSYHTLLYTQYFLSHSVSSHQLSQKAAAEGMYERVFQEANKLPHVVSECNVVLITEIVS